MCIIEIVSTIKKNWKLIIICLFFVADISLIMINYNYRTIQKKFDNDKETLMTNRNLSEDNDIVVEEALAEKKKIAITFDDGPHPIATAKILDGLKERNVKATFFVTGSKAENYPDLLKRMQDEGHIIGNHTYSHLQYTKKSKQEFIEEVNKTSQIIFEITGEEVVYVRPPFGSWHESLEKELNLIPVFWSIDPQDWCCYNAHKVFKEVIKNAKENSVILMHDCYGSTVEASMMIIDELQKQGYEFVTIDHVLLN